MFGLDILDIGIGLIFIYLLLSLICSSIHELIESKLKNRATDLERGLRELLRDPSGTDLAKRFYEHGLISSLFKGAYTAQPITKLSYLKKTNLPTYIPARNFALALLDIVAPASAISGSAPASATAGSDGEPGMTLQDPVSTTPAPTKQLLDAINSSVALAGSPKVQEALRTLVASAGDDVAAARANIEGWFNSSMDRVSGWYKRRSQWFILVIAIIMTVAMNGDTVMIAKYLATNSAVRNTLVAGAGEFIKQRAAEPSDQSPEQVLDSSVAIIRASGLPVGWTGDRPTDWALSGEQRTYSLWIGKIFGWLLTAAAVSLGAPFWFDLLNKIMVVRSTVKPHEKSPEEKSED